MFQTSSQTSPDKLSSINDQEPYDATTKANSLANMNNDSIVNKSWGNSIWGSVLGVVQLLFAHN
eukprot:4455181-Amphidinium_carterae.1